jgi:hypothetical protein
VCVRVCVCVHHNDRIFLSSCLDSSDQFPGKNTTLNDEGPLSAEEEEDQEKTFTEKMVAGNTLHQVITLFIRSSHSSSVFINTLHYHTLHHHSSSHSSSTLFINTHHHTLHQVIITLHHTLHPHSSLSHSSSHSSSTVFIITLFIITLHNNTSVTHSSKHFS